MYKRSTFGSSKAIFVVYSAFASGVNPFTIFEVVPGDRSLHSSASIDLLGGFVPNRDNRIGNTNRCGNGREETNDCPLLGMTEPMATKPFISFLNSPANLSPTHAEMEWATRIKRSFSQFFISVVALLT